MRGKVGFADNHRGAIRNVGWNTVQKTREFAQYSVLSGSLDTCAVAERQEADSEKSSLSEGPSMLAVNSERELYFAGMYISPFG